MPRKKKSKPDEKPFLYEGSDYLFSLSKFTGKKIADITGYPSGEFGPSASTFKIAEIVFEDGTNIFVEGEHDFPYLPADDELNNMDEETLQSFVEEEDVEP